MGRKVICTCPECVQHHVIVNDQKIPGHRVSQQCHQLAATANHLPDFAKAGNPHPIGVQELSDEYGDGQDKSKNSLGMQHLCALCVLDNKTFFFLPGLVIDSTLIIQLCSALLVWLNLKAGVVKLKIQF
jgi:hypothetical protein